MSLPESVIRLAFTPLETLKYQLSAFGLDPQEWNLLKGKATKTSVIFAHRSDSNFKIHGELRKCDVAGLSLRSLRVASL